MFITVAVNRLRPATPASVRTGGSIILPFNMYSNRASVEDSMLRARSHRSRWIIGVLKAGDFEAAEPRRTR